MKRLAFAVLLVGLTVWQVAGQAQAPADPRSWYTATTYVVKAGMMPEFRQLIIKELNPAAKKGGLAGSQVWRFSTGNTNRVLRIVQHDSLADKDGPTAAQKGMGDAGFAAFGKKFNPLIESSSTYVGRQRLDMGWNPAGSPAPKIAERSTIRVAPGRNADYMKFVQALLEAYKKSGHRRTAGQIKAIEQDARFAPSGQWFSYSSNETGRFEIYVQSYPPGSGKWQISNGGGAQSMWSANGRELFYKNGDRMMEVDVELGATFKASTPRALFEMPMPERDPRTPARYAVTPDAQRFLVLTTAEGASEAAATPQITVVLNYAQALKR